MLTAFLGSGYARKKDGFWGNFEPGKELQKKAQRFSHTSWCINIFQEYTMRPPLIRVRIPYVSGFTLIFAGYASLGSLQNELVAPLPVACCLLPLTILLLPN
jgi:hypothetical protein